VLYILNPAKTVLFQKKENENPMKKRLLTILLFTISVTPYAQIILEKGYFINETNERVTCEIKNLDWKNNPTEFEYCLSSGESLQKASIDTIKEFGLIGGSKYVRSKVLIDRSDNDVNHLSTQRNPDFKEELLYLKVLIEGRASLYLYEDGRLIRFFYSKNDSSIQQLVYKQYLVDNVYDRYERLIQNRIGENKYYQQQILVDLNCDESTSVNIRNLRYSQKDLEKVFINYNECTNSASVTYNTKQKRDWFNLTLRPGLNSSSLSIKNTVTDFWNTDFDNELTFRMGIETEFVLPFNKNKWSLIIEPTYQYYESENSETTTSIQGGIIHSEVNYHSIEIPFGIRHAFYLGHHSKLLVDLACVVDFSNDSNIKFYKINGTLINSLDIKSRPNAAIGIGYQFKEKYSFELRYLTDREFLSDYTYWSGSKYKTCSIILGYSIF